MMTQPQLDVPMLAGSRERARQILTFLPEGDLSDRPVSLYCGSLVAASAAFADEIVHEVLVTRYAAVLQVFGVSDQEFIGHLRDRAEYHAVSDRLIFLGV